MSVPSKFTECVQEEGFIRYPCGCKFHGWEADTLEGVFSNQDFDERATVQVLRYEERMRIETEAAQRTLVKMTLLIAGLIVVTLFLGAALYGARGEIASLREQPEPMAACHIVNESFRYEIWACPR